MKTKRAGQLLTLAMGAVMTISTVLPAFAAHIDSGGTIACERMDERERNTKVFGKKDGTCVSVVSGAPIRDQKNGRWNEIDNTLEPKVTETGCVPTNRSNSYTAEHLRKLDEGRPIVLKQNGYELSFVMEDIHDSKAAVEKRKPVSRASEAE